MTLAEIKARMARDKAAGVKRSYPQHRGKVHRRGHALMATPCVHRGEELTGQEREALGLDHRRRWTLCLHDEQPLGAAVCSCKGCGANCPGYAPS
jgi:hypothetical protein